MLFEVHNVKQPESDSIRRWFTDPYFDLIVWYDIRNDISGFQLCYNKSLDEHSITWKKDEGFLHNRIDDGEVPGQAKMTPILVPDGAFDKMTIAEQFNKESQYIEPDIRDFVYKKILDY
jgi:hypothetical protein